MLVIEGRVGETTIKDLRRRGHEVEVGPDWSEGRLTAASRGARAAAPPPIRAACRATRPGDNRKRPPSMKITRVSGVVYRQQLKLTARGRISAAKRAYAFETLLVKVETDAGVTGWGEAFPHRVWPALRMLIDTTIGPACVGADAADIAGLMKKLAYLVS